MRYTTIIDISEVSSVYRNRNARIIYLHMVLKSGWHDNDRDLIDISIRNLAFRTGLTISATRHALQQLEHAGLIARQGTLWAVKKFIFEEPVTPRARTKAQQKQLDAAVERRRNEAKREQEREIEAAIRTRNFDQGKTSFMIYYESLLEQAKAGDVDAQKAVERNRKAYEQQKKSMEENQKKIRQ